MDAIDDVKKWMTFLGWRDGGAPGSFKVDREGTELAKHGDATWIADVQHACDQIERERAREAAAELKRRYPDGVGARSR